MSTRPLYFLVGDLAAPGGQERIMTMWARILMLHGRAVTLISETAEKPFFDPGPCPVDVLPLDPNRSAKRSPVVLVRRILRFRRWLGSKPPGTVVMTKSVYLTALPFIRIFPSARRHRFVYYSHTSTTQLLNRFPTMLMRALVASMDRLICLYDDAPNVPGWFREKLLLLPNPSPFAPQGALGGERANALFLGRFSPEKGLDLLLHAWARIEAHPTLASWRLRMVGEGSEETSLRELAGRLGLRRVDWFPASRSVEDHYRVSSVFVMTSHFEGLPMVMLEALSFGLVTVSTDHTGARQLLTGPLSRTVISSRDPREFADLLENVLMDRALREDLASLSLARSADFQPEKEIATWTRI